MTRRRDLRAVEEMMHQDVLEVDRLRAELEATKALLDATRAQLSETVADFCALRDALPRDQVRQILAAKPVT